MTKTSETLSEISAERSAETATTTSTQVSAKARIREPHKLTVVVVNWNAGDQLRRCLESLEANYPAIVVDNASTDGSCDGIDSMGRVTLINAGENLGFGKACNLGAMQVSSEYVLFLNPDAAVFPGTTERSLHAMDAPENTHIGICGVQLVDESGKVERSCARFPTAGRLLAQTIGLDRVLKSLSHMMIDWSHESTREVDQVMGAFFLVRKKVYDSLHGFDERFFMYFEEVDLAQRAHQTGWRSLYLADVQAFHAGGGTSKQIKAKRLFYVLRSRLIYADKHFGRMGTWLVITATCLLEPVSRSALALSRRSSTELRETWQGFGMLWRWLPKWLCRGVAR